MSDELSTLGIEQDTGQVIVRRRETFLLSVIAHLLVIILFITKPELFRPSPRQFVLPKPEQDVTMLYQPPPAEKIVAPVPEPKPPEPSEPREPIPPREPNQERPVFPRLPNQSPAPAREPPGLGGDRENLRAQRLPPIGLPSFPEGPAPKASGKGPEMEPVRPPEPLPSQAQLQLPAITSPGRGTESILRGLAQQRASGGQGVMGGFDETGPGDSNFSLPGPQLLSDPMGVDFHPYLLRVYLIVRRNWYSVIPEIARLGRQGKVALQFSISKNGAVPDLLLVSGSGTESMDTAALASIRLSNPFPPLPAEFPGNDIRLQFVYLYNLPWNY